MTDQGHGEFTDLQIFPTREDLGVALAYRLTSAASILNDSPLADADTAVADALACVADGIGAEYALAVLYDWDNRVASPWAERPSAGIQSCPPSVPFSDMPDLLLKHHSSGKPDYSAIHPGIAHGLPAISVPMMAQEKALGACCFAAIPAAQRRLPGMLPGLKLFCALLAGFLLRIRAEQSRGDAAESSRLLLDSTRDAIGMLDTGGVILSINGCFATRFGKKPGQLIGHNWSGLTPLSRYGDLLERWMRIFNQVLKARKPQFFEDYRDGRWFDNRFYPVFKKGGVVAVTIISTDITDKKRLEEEKQALAMLQTQTEERRKKEEEYLEILNSTTEGNFVVDFETGETHYSDKWLKRLGLSGTEPTEMLGKFFERMRQEDVAAIISDWDKAARMMLSKFRREYQITDGHGKTLWALIQGKLIYNETGRLAKAYGTFIDITERKRMELALKKQAEQLLERTRLVNNFFINVSHEFRTPLSVLLMMLDTMDIHLEEARCEYGGGIKNVCGEMRLSVYRLMHLIGNILDATKIEAGFDRPVLEELDVVALADEVVEAVRDHVRGTGISLVFSPDTDSRMMPMDSAKLEKILLNLLSNAVKHSPSGGRVILSMRNSRNSVRIAVQDQGPGIPADKVGQIFDRFRHAGSPSRVQVGCGIGLSLTKSLVELLGGRICVESRPGHGSRFFVELPALPLTEPSPRAAQEGLTLAQQVQIAFSDTIFDGAVSPSRSHLFLLD